MHRMNAFGLAVLAILSIAAAAAVTGPRTLVLVDNAEIKQTHSTFFKSLTDRGHQLTFSHVYNDDTKLVQYGEFFFDNLVVFAPTAEDFGESISVETIVSFIDSGRNVLVAVDEKVAEPLRDLANECGIDFDEEGTQVMDHLDFDLADQGSHTLIAVDSLVKISAMLGSKPLSPILFKGIGHLASEGSRLITKLLTGTETSFSHKPDSRVEEYPQSTGTDTLLVTAIQTRNNGRIVFAGSLAMFSNHFFNAAVNTVNGVKAAKSGNEAFCTQLGAWTFHERGLIRASGLTHHLVGSNDKNPLAYRVEDFIAFSIKIEEFVGNAWVPFVADDVQLEFTMLDPYQRITLKHDGKGLYSTEFQAPDVYGVYKFVLNYQRPGVSNLNIEQQVSVHPYRHNQFERFIPAAFPYYASSFTTMAAFFVFGIVFLYSKNK